MKRILLLVIMGIVTLNGAFAQTGPKIQWQKTLGGTLSDGTSCIKPTNDGGYIMAGSTESNDSDVSGNHGDYDAWVVKMNSTGKIQWQKCFGGSGFDEAYYIEQTTDGGYVISGVSNSDDGDVSGYHVGFPYLYIDAWIIKIDSLGNIQWQKCFGGSNLDKAYEVHQTIDKGFIVVGETNSNDGDVIGQHNAGLSDIWVLKMDSIGVLQWQKCLGGSSQDYGHSILQKTDGSYIVAGETYSTDGDVVGNHGGFDGWLVNLNNTGGIIWQKCYGGSGGEYIYSILQTIDKNYIFCGTTGGSTDGDLTGITTYGGGDYWVIKTDSVGVILWEKCYGGKKGDEATKIQSTSDGGYIIIGTTESDSVMNVNASNFHGVNDYWMVKLDSIGNLLWQNCLGGRNDDDGLFILQTKDNGYIVCGDANSSDGDVLFLYGIAGGYSDCWIMKLMPDILPLTLLDFNATLNHSNHLFPKDKVEVQLSWVTTNEINVSYFNIQRSINCKDFITIGSVNIVGNTAKQHNYSYSDLTSLYSYSQPTERGVTIYYRLEIVDKDGTKTYSEIRTINLPPTINKISAYPNPANEFIMVNANDAIKNITLVNVLGKTVLVQNLNSTINQTTIPVKNIANGVYTIQITTMNGIVDTKQILIQH